MPEALKIILATDPIHYPLTGIGRYTLELARGLLRHPAVAVCRWMAHGRWQDDPFAVPQPRGAGDRPSLRTWLAGFSFATGAYGLVIPAVAGLRLSRMGDHLYHGPAFLLPPLRGPGVVTIHDLSTLRHPEFHPGARVRFVNEQLRRALDRATLVLTVSEFSRQELGSLLGYPLDRTVVIPNGCPASFRPLTDETTAGLLHGLGLRHGGYLLSLATLEPRKNLVRLMNAWASLPEGVRNRFPLVLAGSSGWLSQPILARIGELVPLGLRYLGYLPDEQLRVLLAGCRGLVFLSIYEGFGLPVLEGLASGVPVLAARGSALPEAGGGLARYVDPFCSGAIREGLTMLMEDDVWRSQAADAGPAWAAHFPWQRTVNETVRAYQRAMALHFGPGG